MATVDDTTQGDVDPRDGPQVTECLGGIDVVGGILDPGVGWRPFVLPVPIEDAAAELRGKDRGRSVAEGPVDSGSTQV